MRTGHIELLNMDAKVTLDEQTLQWSPKRLAHPLDLQIAKIFNTGPFPLAYQAEVFSVRFRTAEKEFPCTAWIDGELEQSDAKPGAIY